MSKKLTIVLLLLFSLMLTVVPGAGAQVVDTVYVALHDQPDAGYFLPAPPSTNDMDYVDDMIQWQWGKTQRHTPRGYQASRESWWVPNMMRIVMAEVLGLDTITNERTPALSRLIEKTYNTGNLSTASAKKKYMRIRPFVEMGEDTWAKHDTDYLRTNGSYPSGHTAFGWATALVFAEMWPELQDTILRRGFQFGENRIITGAHYQSDVNAGYLCAAASIARAHANPELAKDIAAARAEYIRIKGLPEDYDPVAKAGFPKGVKILNAPVDTTHYRYVADILRYKKARLLRSTERGRQAVADVDTRNSYFAAIFGNILGITISKEATPTIWKLMDYVKEHSGRVARELKDQHFRKRPYVQLGDTTPAPEEEESHFHTSSYASAHANIGWSLALVMAEMAPEEQNELLRFGYDYGYSRLITGYHWATDIEAGRLLACAFVARLHADPSFAALMQQAHDEYLRAKSGCRLVTLTDVVPDAILEIRYYSTYNFVGKRIDGYEEPTALLTSQAADSLRAVSDDLKAQGYRLKIYDAYRPQKAVDHFMHWAEDLSDTLMRPYFYPDLDKSVLFEREYIMEKSGHTRGSTVDLTLFDMKTEKEADMGGTFDWFGPESHPDFCGNPDTGVYTGDNSKSPDGRRITAEQFKNRMILRQAMLRHGFVPFNTEWWHFTLKNEPYPNTYFTFPVKEVR